MRRFGIDATTTEGARLKGVNDGGQLAYARLQARALVTHDEDFLSPGVNTRPHHGIVYCHQKKFTIGRMIGSLVRLERDSGPTLKGRVIFL